MEFEFPSMLSLVVVSCVLFVWIVCKLRNERDDLDRIPGPMKLPVIGNLHLLLTSKSPPHHVFRELAVEYGGLMRLQLGGVPFLIVSSVEVAEQVLKTHDVAFANRPPMHTAAAVTYNYTDIGVAPYGEYWRNLRKICTLELLSSRRVASFRRIREEEGRNLARRIAAGEGSPVNLSEGVHMSSFDVTTRAAVGREVEAEEKRRMRSAIHEIMKLGSGLTITDIYPSIPLLAVITGLDCRIGRRFRQTDRILQRIINGHKAAKATNGDGDGDGMQRSEDLVDVLLKYQQDSDPQVHLTDDNIKAVIMDMFLAGGENPGAAVEWAMSEMVRNPSTMKRAQDEVRRVVDDKGWVDEAKFAELKYLKLVVKETLRLHPPLALLVPRQNSERCQVNGYQVAAKTRVMVNAWALGRDPAYWAHADKFTPERFEDSSVDFKGHNLEYIPFGAGRRMCPGMSFGLATVEFFLATLLYHFDWALPQGDLDMTEAIGATAKRKHHLFLIPTLNRPF